MLLFLFLSALSLGAASPLDGPEPKLQRGACPMFWFSFNDRCYKYVATQMGWADAELHCLSQGANLVSIHSQGEQEFVNSLIKNFDHSMGRTWMGFHDLYKEGRWTWSDGCPVRFTYWLSGQPDNGHGRENCAHLNYGSPLKWNDGECPWAYPSVCATRIICP